MPGFKPKGSSGGGGRGKLSGGHWVTIHGHPAYIKDGKVVAGGLPGHTHGKDGRPTGPVRHGGQPSIPMHPKKGGHADSGRAREHALGPDHERAADERASRREYRKAIGDHAKAKADHAAARKALKAHDAAAAAGKPGGKLDQLEARRAAAHAKVAGLKAQLAAHEARAGGKAGGGKSAGRSPRSEQHTPESYAAKHGIGGANAFRHLDQLHRAGKVALDPHTGQYHVPHGTPAPRGGHASATHPTAKTSAPRDARESALLAHARSRGKQVAVVTSAPQYRAEKSGSVTRHLVGGREVASQHTEGDRHVVTVRHADGSRSVYRHKSAAAAKQHVVTLARAATRAGTTRHAVISSDLSRFDHRAHGLGGADHKVTARVLGDGRSRVAVRRHRHA